jgi:hypothetical protein
MGFLSIMGKVLIGISLLILPVSVSLIMVFSEILGRVGVVVSLGSTVFVFLCGMYAGMLGMKYERLQENFEAFVNPVRIRPKAANLIKAICPVDHQQAVFVHVSPHRDDALPDGLDLFVGPCGHEAHRGDIEAVAEETETASV